MLASKQVNRLACSLVHPYTVDINFMMSKLWCRLAYHNRRLLNATQSSFCSLRCTVSKPGQKMAYNVGKSYQVPLSLFVENRKRLVDALKAKSISGFVVLEGGKENLRYNTDADDLPFRQESYFFWTFGVVEPDVFGAIDIDTGRSYLFPPKLHPNYVIWDGVIHPEDYFTKKYGVDDTCFHDHKSPIIADFLKSRQAKKLYVLRADNTDSGNVLQPAQFAGIKEFEVDCAALYPVIAELRVFKTEAEINVLRYACKIACDAHRDVMKTTLPGKYEYQSESTFRHTCYHDGACRHLAYTCIAASGVHSSTLHYGHANAPNDGQIRDGDMCLFDMGPEYACYCSDVTVSFPASGKFTDKQKLIYDAVLDANRTVLREAKPGVRWTDMHRLSERVILTHLAKANLVHGDVDEMVNARVGAIFMPHGLGHFIGLDVHDVGGYLGDAEPRYKEPGLQSLRTTRTLRANMVITIEPGCYFIDPVLDKALATPELAKFLNAAEIAKFRGSGGVRIEDDVVIREGGNENLSAALPRTTEEIEDFMKKARR